MKCPVEDCGANTRVTRTFVVNSRLKTTERLCAKGHRLVYQVIFVREVKKRGDGAYALSQELENE